MPPPTRTREAQLAGFVLHQVQADVVPAGGGAVFRRAGDGDLELARQEGELGVQRAPLAQDLAKGRGSAISSTAMPARSSLVMLRMQLPLVWMPCMSTLASRSMTSALLPSGIQLNCTFCARGEVAVADLQVRGDRRAAGHRHRPSAAACPARAAAVRRRAGRIRGRSWPARAAAGWRSRHRARRRAASAHSAGCTSRSAGAAAGNRRRSACRPASAPAGRGTARRGSHERLVELGVLVHKARDSTEGPHGIQRHFCSRLMRISLCPSNGAAGAASAQDTRLERNFGSTARTIIGRGRVGKA